MQRPLFLPALVASVFFSGCDYIGNPLEDADPGNGGGEGVNRRVMIEDFTGHTCNNCPEAAAVALALQAYYGEEDLIVVSVHAGDGFNEPVPPIGDGVLDTDFRTPAGEEYKTTFNIDALPTGLVSRKEFEGSIKILKDDWGAAVDEIINTPADFDLWFSAFSFDGGTNTVDVTVTAAVMNAITTDHNITIYLTEDHVIDDQIDLNATPSLVEDYDHRHVLRDNVNGTWGEAAVVGSAALGDTIALSYSYTLSANVLEPTNCALVAYVYDVANYEVKQVAEVKFVP